MLSALTASLMVAGTAQAQEQLADVPWILLAPPSAYQDDTIPYYVILTLGNDGGPFAAVIDDGGVEFGVAPEELEATMNLSLLDLDPAGVLLDPALIGDDSDLMAEFDQQLSDWQALLEAAEESGTLSGDGDGTTFWEVLKNVLLSTTINEVSGTPSGTVISGAAVGADGITQTARYFKRYEESLESQTGESFDEVDHDDEDGVITGWTDLCADCGWIQYLRSDTDAGDVYGLELTIKMAVALSTDELIFLEF